MTDRHGRAAHGDGDHRRRPPGGFRLRDARRFRQLVEDCVAALPPTLRRRAARLQVRVVDVPADDNTAVAVYDAAAERLTVYRRPAELRARTCPALTEVVRTAVATEVAQTLGLGVDDLDEPGPDRD